MEDHTVYLRLVAQIHGNPFIFGAFALPAAGEMHVGKRGYQHIVLVAEDIVQLEVLAGRVVQGNPESGIRSGGREGEDPLLVVSDEVRLPYPAFAGAHRLALSQGGPVLSVRGAFQHNDALHRRIGRYHNLVRHYRIAVETENSLQVRSVAHGAHGALVIEVVALALGQRLAVDPGLLPGGGTVRNNAVRSQLSREVIVPGRRMRGDTVERQIAVGRTAGNHFGAGVFGRISGINANAAGFYALRGVLTGCQQCNKHHK